jgi:type IX secretion system PorP/SprF family membrane protein
MKQKVLYLAIFLLCGAGAFAQQDALVSQYMFNGLYLNPAYAGSHDYWSSSLTYRNQWVRFDGAPTTVIAAVDGPIPDKNMGLGFIFMNDCIGVTRHNTFIANYAYQLKINETDKLAFGINAGVSQFNETSPAGLSPEQDLEPITSVKSSMRDFPFQPFLRIRTRTAIPFLLT